MGYDTERGLAALPRIDRHDLQQRLRASPPPAAVDHPAEKWRPASALREGDLFLWLSHSSGVVADEVRKVSVGSGFALMSFRDGPDLRRPESELQRVASGLERAAIREHGLEGVQHLAEELARHAAALKAREHEDVVRNNPNSTSAQRNAAKDARKAAEFAAMVVDHPELLQADAGVKDAFLDEAAGLPSP